LPDVATWRDSYCGAGPTKTLMRAALVELQHGQCGLCLREIGYLQCDHDHVTCLVRCMLSQSCNNREGNRWAESPVLDAYRSNPPASGAGWLWQVTPLAAAAWRKVGHGTRSSMPVVVPPELLDLASVVELLVLGAADRQAREAGAILQTVVLPNGESGKYDETEAPPPACTGKVDWWSVEVEHGGDDPSFVTDDALSVLATELTAHSGSVIGGGGHAQWGARLSVRAPSAVDAVTAASVILYRAGGIADLPNWSVVRAQAIREDTLRP
jgi:hypothetical protein